MGNSSGFELKYDHEGEWPELLTICDHLGVTNTELSNFLKLYRRLDTNHDGLIDADSIAKYFGYDTIYFLYSLCDRSVM